MKRVLVTGAGGFIGRQCIPYLTSAGYEVHGVTASLSRSATRTSGVRWHGVDLLQPGAAAALVHDVQPSHLLHLAWIATPGEYWQSDDNPRWTEASIELAAAFWDAGGARAVFAGTCAEYDWSGGDCDELDTPLAPQSPYSQSKHALHEALSEAGRGSFAWGRVFFTYGPEEHPDKLVASLIRPLLAGETAETTEGEHERDFMNVLDVAGALVATLRSTVTGAVNIGTGQAPRIRDIASFLAASIGRPELLSIGARPSPPDEPPLIRAVPRRLLAEVGYRPTYDLESGLRHTIEWWRQQSCAEGPRS